MPTSEALLHRRQFVLGPDPFARLPGWRTERLGGRWLSLHPDLACTVARGPEADAALVGFAVDPFAPGRTDVDLTADLSAAPSFDEVAERLATWSGTFVVVWARGGEVRVVADACGLREVFYTTDGPEWVGSEPSLLARVADLRPDPDRDAFERTAGFERAARLWPVHRTPYANVRKLLPNHALDVPSLRAERVYPTAPLPPCDAAAGIEALTRTLGGGVEAFARRGPLRLALTGGWDSRVLLGACRPVLDRVACFTIVHPRPTPTGPMDLRVARRLADRLGFPLDPARYADAASPPFREAVDQSLTGGLPRYALLEHVFLDRPMILSGFGSEVARFFYSRAGRTTPEKLARLVYGEAHPVPVAAFGAWLAEAGPLAERLGYSVLDLFYWEQRLGVWGAKSWTETALACEITAPFANRALLTTLLGVPARLRGREAHPLYRRALRQMWPEALGVPVNPRWRSRVIRTLEQARLYGPYETVRDGLAGLARRAGGAVR